MWCKKLWWFILCIFGFIIMPFIFWWIGQYYLSVTIALISWLGAILLTIVFFMSWHDIKKVYNKCQKDIEESKTKNNQLKYNIKGV